MLAYDTQDNNSKMLATKVRLCILIFFLTVFKCVLTFVVYSDGYRKLNLKFIESIKFHHDRKARRVRSKPVPQLKCVGGSADCDVRPEIVDCANLELMNDAKSPQEEEASETETERDQDEELQWKCNASLDKEYTLRAVSIDCEGYDYPEDPYILRGSCQLKYTIDYSDLFFEWDNMSKDPPSYDEGLQLRDILTLVCAVFFVVAIYRRNEN